MPIKSRLAARHAAIYVGHSRARDVAVDPIHSPWLVRFACVCVVCVCVIYLEIDTDTDTDTCGTDTRLADTPLEPLIATGDGRWVCRSTGVFGGLR